MGQTRHSWREVCDSALGESDPQKLIGCIEYAITALERRYAEWDSDPGTRAELNSIQKTVLALERHMKEKVGAVPAQEFSGTTHQSVGRALEHISRSLFLMGPH